MKENHLIWLIVVISLQISTAKWCTKMGSRAYIVEVGNVNQTKYITKIERFCCDGYSLNGTECKPICQQGCPNGVCEEPDKCVCNQGYNLNTLSNICEPLCSSPCGFGKCIKPETCECEPGHAMDSSTKMCEPVCTTKCTAHSKCLRPNHCECDAGYTNNQTTKLCEPFCNNKCINGFCSAPDICECNKGYSNYSITTQACRANHCRNHCVLGYCETNGECQCYPGHTKSFVMGNTHCETIALYAIKLLCIFLSVILVLAIIIVIIVKIVVKKGTYKPKKTEDEFKKKMTKI